MEYVAALFSWFFGIPWLKFAYSLLLLSLISVVSIELKTVWFDKTVFLNQFEYFDGGKKEAGKAQSLRTQVQHHHHLLKLRVEKETERRAKQQENETHTKDTETAWLPDSNSGFATSGSSFSKLEMTVQGINISQLLTAVRRSASNPNEINGTISRNKNTANTIVNWPRAPKAVGSLENSNGIFEVAGDFDDDAVAFQIACSLLWVEASSRRKSKLILVSRDDFCTWAYHWSNFFDIRERHEKGFPLTEKSSEILIEILKYADNEIAKNTSYPEIYLLRANVIDIKYDTSDQEDAQAISDLQTFRDLINGKTLAESKSEKDKEFDVSTNFERIVGQVDKPTLTLVDLVKDKSSVGFIRDRNSQSPYVGTAFVVGPNKVLTQKFVVDNSGKLTDEQLVNFEFVLSDQVGSKSAQFFKIKSAKFLRAASHELALLTVPGIAESGIEAVDLAGGDHVVGEELHLIGFMGGGDAKILTQGKLLALELGEQGSQILYDANTGPGASGAPVFRSSDGKVIGVHIGKNRSTGDEFNYGTLLNREIISMIAEP